MLIKLYKSRARALGKRFITVENRWKYEYACEDEYYEKEMNMYDAHTLPLPLPDDYVSKQYPVNDILPAHWNDVRFNYIPENVDRRMFKHDNLMNFYTDGDTIHSHGFPEEDLDYELPDPVSAMHFNKKRSAPIAFLGALGMLALYIFYPMAGFKFP